MVAIRIFPQEAAIFPRGKPEFGLEMLFDPFKTIITLCQRLSVYENKILKIIVISDTNTQFNYFLFQF
jgi:hypothetical protein